MSRTREQAGSSKSSGSAGSTEEKEKEKENERIFECNICLDTAKDAVVSMCGLLFWYLFYNNIACRRLHYSLFFI